MKTNQKLLTYAAATSVFGFIVGLATSTAELGLFAAAVSTLIGLVVTTDYAPHRTHAKALIAAATQRERLPFAA